MCSRKNICASRHEDNEFLLDMTTMQNTRLRNLGKVDFQIVIVVQCTLPMICTDSHMCKCVIRNAISSIMSRNYIFMNCIILSILKSDRIHFARYKYVASVGSRYIKCISIYFSYAYITYFMRTLSEKKSYTVINVSILYLQSSNAVIELLIFRFQ